MPVAALPVHHEHRPLFIRDDLTEAWRHAIDALHVAARRMRQTTRELSLDFYAAVLVAKCHFVGLGRHSG